MPSSTNYNNIATGPGRIHIDVVSAAAELFTNSASGALSDLASVLDQPLATPVFKGYTAGGGGDASRVIASGDGPFYVGDNVSDDLKDLFMVVDAATDAQIFNPHTRLYVATASISASVGTGFTSSAVTVTFNTPVPANVQYKIYYGRRSTLGSLPVELASNPVIRRSPDRVRFPEFDRTGYAPTSISNDIDYTGVDGYPDPYLAQWKAILKGTTAATINTGRSGATGYVHVGSKQNVADINDVTLRNVSSAGFLAVVEKDIKSATLAGNAPYTKIDSSLAATVQNNNEVLLNSADYFRLTGPNRTAIRLGVDMLEITFANGYKGVYFPISFDVSNARLVQIVTLGGVNPNLTTDANVRVKWVRPTFFAGASESPTALYEMKGTGYLVAGAITTTPSAEIPQTAPFYMAGTLDPARADSGNNNWNIKSLCWGSFTETGASTNTLGLKTIKGELWGDGSVQSFGGRIKGLHANRPKTVTFAATGGDGIDPRATSQIRYDLTTTSTKVITLNLDGTYTPQEGDKVTVIISHTGTGASRTSSSVVWPSGWKFSGTDADISNFSPDTVIPYLKFEGTYVNGICLFTRTDYEV